MPLWRGCDPLNCAGHRVNGNLKAGQGQIIRGSSRHVIPLSLPMKCFIVQLYIGGARRAISVLHNPGVETI